MARLRSFARRIRSARRRRLVAAVVIGAGTIAALVCWCRARHHAKASALPIDSYVNPHGLSGLTIVLDPGHGGADSGARRASVREDVINYRMASAVAALLLARGARVLFTVRSAALLPTLREEPEEKGEPALIQPRDARLIYTGSRIRLRVNSAPDDLYRRAAVAAHAWRALSAAERASGRNFYFLALHCDDLGNAQAYGAAVYYDQREKGPSRLAFALQTHLTNAGLSNPLWSRPIPRRYGVLNPLYNPLPESVLLEMATLSNPQDRKRVLTPAWRWRMARIIAGAIADCSGRTL